MYINFTAGGRVAGVNVTAIYQDDELTDKETFQVEFEKRTDQWRLRTGDDTYWILVESGSGIQSNGNARYYIGMPVLCGIFTKICGSGPGLAGGRPEAQLNKSWA